MTKTVSCCLIGDVNIDHISDMSHTAICSESNPCFQNSISSGIGGNAVFFAESAVEAGFADISLLCSVGNDIAGSRALKHLRHLGVSVHNVTSKYQTGQVIIIYQPGDNRIMIADRGANKEFRLPEAGLCPQMIGRSDLLYVSGYMLLDDEQCATVHRIANLFRSSGSKIMVDMVPHDIWCTKTWSKYLEMCSFADCVATELTTISRFHDFLSVPMNPEEAADQLLKEFEFCLIRINDKSDFMLADKRARRVVSIPYTRDTASLRFTDRVIAHGMLQYVADRRSIFESDGWLKRVKHSVSGGH